MSQGIVHVNTGLKACQGFLAAVSPRLPRLRRACPGPRSGACSHSRASITPYTCAISLAASRVKAIGSRPRVGFMCSKMENSV